MLPKPRHARRANNKYIIACKLLIDNENKLFLYRGNYEFRRVPRKHFKLSLSHSFYKFVSRLLPEVGAVARRKVFAVPQFPHDRGYKSAPNACFFLMV